MPHASTSLSQRHAVRSTGEGRPIVFGHGLGGTQAHWDPIVSHFAGRARLITFSLAGSADADRRLFSPTRHASVLGFADDLARLCAELELRDAIYVGHSMSAMAGALAAAADPGLFSKLVLLNASARYVDDAATAYAGGFSQQQVDEVRLAVSADFATWAGGFAPLMMGNPERPEFSTEFARTLRAYDPAVAPVLFRAAFTSDFRTHLRRVTPATLLLQSPNDPAVPLEAARWLERQLPNARLRVLRSTGHFPHVVSPAEVIAELESFVFGAS